MRSKAELEKILNMSRKEMEQTIGIKIVNGQGSQAVKSTINWVLGNKNQIASVSDKYSGNTQLFKKGDKVQILDPNWKGKAIKYVKRVDPWWITLEDGSQWKKDLLKKIETE